jgi:prepilin-type N-terminal cleavage/methylation domain-containing protein
MTFPFSARPIPGCSFDIAWRLKNNLFVSSGFLQFPFLCCCQIANPADGRGVPAVRELAKKRSHMRTRNRQRGFTLIELLIVVTIILIIAAFTIPRITKSQIPAHEASAIASLKAINEAEMIYSSSHPDAGFTPDLQMLGGTAQGGGEQTIDNALAGGRKSGYTFTYTPGEKVNGAIRSYTITGVPDQVGTTGQRRFFSDESGEVHYNADGTADGASPVISN